MERRFEDVLGTWREGTFIAKHRIVLSDWHITLAVYDVATRLVASYEQGYWLWYQCWLDAEGNISREESWTDGERDADPARHRPSESIMKQVRKELTCITQRHLTQQ